MNYLKAEHLKFKRAISNKLLFIAPFLPALFAWIVGGCISTAVMQAVLQPLLSAKSPEAARVGSILGYVIAAPICFFTAICGMLSKASGADLGELFQKA